jgi:DNA topoisomerase IB
MARLRRSDLTGPGVVRRRCGRGFSYRWTSGDKVTDEETLIRIRGLVLPPAWSDVWICPWPHGHIQAIGTDAAGRRQYRYHDDWRKRKDKEKFERAISFGLALPSLRQAVKRDLAARGLVRRRVLATGIRLLDLGCFRVGGEEYAEEHETFGVATLRQEHVRVHKETLLFEYPAKGSILRTVSIDDAEVRRVIRSLRRGRHESDDLLAWRKKGAWVDVRSDDLNDYIKAEAGDEFSAKDFRTWSATVHAGMILARDASSMQSISGRRRAVTAAVKEVSELLGNTPAVCRSAYIDPRIIDRFNAGETVAHALERVGRGATRTVRQRALEAAVIDLLSAVAEVAA